MRSSLTLEEQSMSNTHNHFVQATHHANAYPPPPYFKLSIKIAPLIFVATTLADEVVVGTIMVAAWEVVVPLDGAMVVKDVMIASSCMGKQAGVGTSLGPNQQQPWSNIPTTQHQAFMCGQPNNMQYLRYPSDRSTTLPQAFSTMSLQDPDNAVWYMNTVAITHLYVDPTTLKSFSNKCTNSNLSVLVGDEYRIPVTKIGHSALPYNPDSMFLHAIF
ncbi:hypothetical protein LXL04_017925 [Taraxacum kok-saghyz]